MDDRQPFTQNGSCRDCAQGILTPATEGFAQHIDDGELRFWYCRHCGSNHVDIHDADGNVSVSQGDLYETEEKEVP